MHDDSPEPWANDNACSGVPVCGDSTLILALKRSGLKFCLPPRERCRLFLARGNMPTAQEIREYLEKHGIQNALTAAVNAAIQAKATNPLEFIGDLLRKGGVPGAGGAVQSAQIVQAASCSTMVSHQVAHFVDAGSEAGAKAAAEKEAAAALIQNAAARA